MLRGRESLARLVGKRRRFLPNRESLLSSLPSSLNPWADEDGKIVSTKSSIGSVMAVRSDDKNKVESFGGREERSDVKEEVTCPVCGNKMRGNNYTINSHLDMCLSRGTKRKLTQQTLLQMHFCSPAKVQICSSAIKQLGSNLLRINRDEKIVRNGVNGLPDFDCCDENDDTSNLSESILNLGSAMHKDGLSKSSICDDKTNDIDTHFLTQNNEVPYDDMAITLDDISGVILETFIVGRKFSDAKEINVGERISLVRDPHNVKDPNAVKIISADSSEPKVLGFLPRVLAQLWEIQL